MAGYDLKNEEDVKLYLKNLFTEYKFGCYSEKIPEVCHLLGDYYESIKLDYNEAAKIYKNNCDNLDSGRSCAKYGGYSLGGKGCTKDMKEAFKYMKKGCQLEDEIGCTNAGIIATTVDEIQEGNRKAVIDEGIKMLEKSCHGKKSEKACFYLSGIYLKGREGFIEKNLIEAYKLSLKACEYGNPYACANLAQMHARGEGAQKNPELAETFKQRAIELEKQVKEFQQPLKFGVGIDT